MERFTFVKKSALGPYMGTDPNGFGCEAKEYDAVAAERDEWKIRADRAEKYVGIEWTRSDFQTAAQMRATLELVTKERDALREALRLHACGVVAGKLACERFRACHKTEGGAGGQTVEECLALVRYHNVPMSIFVDLYDAEAAIYDNAEARKALMQSIEDGCARHMEKPNGQG